jgi:hypothetical protein
VTDYGLIAVKRSWVPEWLWWLACCYVPTIKLKQLVMCWPFRWLLARPV